MSCEAGKKDVGDGDDAQARRDCESGKHAECVLVLCTLLGLIGLVKKRIVFQGRKLS